MLSAIGFALLYGVLISVTRAANGRMGMARGAFQASFWNHLVGFIFLSVLLLLSHGFIWTSSLPWYAYLGGIMGAFFVAINAYVIPRLGVTKSALLVVSGQMMTGVLMGLTSSQVSYLLIQLLGVGLILFGLYWSQKHRTR